MYAQRLLFVMVLVCLVGTATGQPFTYPESRKDEVKEDYHGTSITDPYRWLEDSDAPETAAWIQKQNDLTFSFLEQIPERQAIKDRLMRLWNYPRYGVPYKKGGQYFFFKNDGLQNQSILYAQKTLKDLDSRVLIDPNTLSTDGTVALTTMAFDELGKRLVYGTSASGSDWQTFKVRDVASGKDLSDELKWIKFSGASWDKKGEGVFYSRYYPPAEGAALEQVNKNNKLYYHRIGTPQEQDVLIYERPDDPEMGFAAEVSHDGRYLFINAWKGTDRRNNFYYKDLKDPGARVVRLFDEFDASYSAIGNTGTTFYMLTDLEAPNRKLVAVDIEKPARENWKVLIPEGKNPIDGVAVINNQFVVSALQDVKAVLTVHDLDGRQIRSIELPGPGSVGGLSGERDDTEMFYSFTSFTYPTTIYRYDFKTGKSEVFRAPEVDFDPTQYESKQVFYPSKDGTKIPMFIVHKKGLKLDGNNPTYLYGYGGFNISMTPAFSISNLVWMEMGGVYAMPNLRGGGEYGEAWHAAGMLDKKQNVFDDFIAAAEYLIREGYTSPDKLAIAGGSNGGLLTGAVLTQRPDLIGSAIVSVGVLDMLRYHKFTIGWGWVPEYGSADDPEQFKTLIKYSPLHNVKPGTKYPATLVMTADHDDRVVPGHSFKFAATLQAAHGGDAPVFIRVDTKAGHGAGKPTSKIIETEADKWAFLVKVLNVTAPSVTPPKG